MASSAKYNEIYKTNKIYKKNTIEIIPFINIWNKIIEYLNELDVPNVVELGSGMGNLVELFDKNRIQKYIGYDFSEYAINYCHNKYKSDTNYSFENINIEEHENFNLDNNICLIACNFLDFIENDISVLKKIPNSTHIIFSVSNYKSSARIRTFKNEFFINERYQDYIDIEKVERIKISNGLFTYCCYGRIINKDNNDKTNTEKNISMTVDRIGEISDKDINKIFDKNINETLNKEIDETLDKNVNETLDENINENFDKNIDKTLENEVHTDTFDNIAKKINKNIINNVIKDKCIVYHNKKYNNIPLTVALPAYNSENIIYLALESLKNQSDIYFNWELIIMEENGPSYELVKEYMDIHPRCVRIIYIAIDKKISLVEKWKYIAELTSDTSKVYVMHATDCYSPPKRLYIHYKHFKYSDCYFSTQVKGLFYHLVTKNKIIYDGYTKENNKKYIKQTHLNMALRTTDMKQITISPLKRNIDGYIKKFIMSNNNLKEHSYIYIDSDIDKENWKYGVDTDGMNNISLKRSNFYKKIRAPFRSYLIRSSLDYTNMENYLPKYIIDFLENYKIKE